MQIRFTFLLILLMSTASSGQSVVRLESSDGKHQLIRNGKPYFVRGGGGETHLKLLSQIGGNSIRTWGSDGIKKTLDSAHSNDLSVSVGFWLGHERHGFDYDDAEAVKKQRDSCWDVVRAHKQHPAVLIWAVGNEMEGKVNNPKIWKAVEEIAAGCKRIDPSHPTMTVIAEPIDDKVKQIEKLCPSIDIVGVNSYGPIQSMPERYRAAGGTKPYIVTEFGLTGHWESPTTDWGAPIELTSTQKAKSYADAYRTAVSEQTGLCMGSYGFYWGNKQETTATWYGMLLPDGTRVAAADVISEAWNGKRLPNLCPTIESVSLDKTSGIRPGEVLHAKLSVSDPESDRLSVNWLLRSDSVHIGAGGDFEPDEQDYPNAATGDSQSARLTLPNRMGAYRLFVYIRDSSGGAAVANVPLIVDTTPEGIRTAQFPLTLFDDGHTEAFAPSGYMGNLDAIKMSISEEQPNSGSKCLKVVYEAYSDWAGVIWQSPANDWGDEPGGWDLDGATALEFYARGETGTEKVNFGLGYLGGDKTYPDSTKAEQTDVELSKQWKRYRIDLSKQNLKTIKTGFGWVVASQGEPITFYLDDIRYVK